MEYISSVLGVTAPAPQRPQFDSLDRKELLALIQDLYARNKSLQDAAQDTINSQLGFIKKFKIEKREDRASVDEAIFHLDVLREVLVTGQTNLKIAKEVNASEKRQDIIASKIALENALKKLRELIANLTVTDKNPAEAILIKLDVYSVTFNNAIRTLQQYHKNMTGFLQQLKETIDYLKNNRIPDEVIPYISQYLVFLDKIIIDDYEHEVRSQMSEYVNVMDNVVRNDLANNQKKLDEWQNSYDEYTTLLFSIETHSRLIECQLHLYQYQKNLKTRVEQIVSTMKDYRAKVDELIEKHTKDVKDAMLESPKIEEEYRTKFKQSVLPEIMQIDRAIHEEIKLLKTLLEANSLEQGHVLLDTFHFYNEENKDVSKRNSEKTFAQSTEMLSGIVDALEKSWREFKELESATMLDWNYLSSSIKRNNGVLLNKTYYDSKEKGAMSYIKGNKKRFPAPTYLN